MFQFEEKKQSQTKRGLSIAIGLFAISVVTLTILISDGVRTNKGPVIDVQAQTTISLQQLAIKELMAENKAAIGKIDALQNKSKAVNSELLRMQKEANSLSGKVTDLQKKLDSSTAELKKVQNYLKELGLTFQ